MTDKHPVFDLMIESIRRDGQLPYFGDGVSASFAMPMQNCGSALPPHVVVEISNESGYHGNTFLAIRDHIERNRDRQSRGGFAEDECVWDCGEEVQELLTFLAKQNLKWADNR